MTRPEISTLGTANEPPLTTARRYVDQELLNRATTEQIEWLVANPYMWLRALIQVQADVKTHIAKRRNDLAELEPEPGEPASRAYLAARRAFDRETTGRIHFARLVERRAEEVASVLGVEPADRNLTSDFVHVLLRIAQLAADDDIEAVKDAALRCAERLTGGREQAATRAARREAKRVAKRTAA